MVDVAPVPESAKAIVGMTGTTERLAGPSFAYVFTVLWTACIVTFVPLVPLMMAITERVALALWSMVFVAVVGTVVSRLRGSGVAIEREQLIVRTTLRTATLMRDDVLTVARKPVWFTPAASQRVPVVITSTGRSIKLAFMIGRSTETIDRVTAAVRRWQSAVHGARSPDGTG